MKYLFYLIILTINLTAIGQNKVKSLEDFTCARHSKFTQKQKSQYYPFNSSSKVVLVSFEESENVLNYKGKSLDNFTFKETKVLGSPETDSLIDLLYNISVKGKTFKFTPAVCYSPRNAILFLTSEGKISEFIEICFECFRTRVSSSKVNDGISCETKFALLKSYFKKQGVKYGTNDGL